MNSNKIKFGKIMYLFLTVAFLTVVFVSCEEDVVDTSGIKYKEQLVIKAFIFAGENAHNIVISRTLHPLEKYNYDQEKALVKNAKATIIHNNQRYNLTYNPNTKCYENSEITFEEGERYRFVVNWKDLQATATTTIPKFEIIKKGYTFDNSSKNYWDWSMYATFVIKGNKNAVYYTNYEYGYNFNYDSLIDIGRQTSDTFTINIYCFDNINIKDSTYYINIVKQRTYIVAGFERSLWDYSMTRLADYSDEGNILGIGAGVNAKWNIQGDGIGLFIGSKYIFVKFE